MFFEKCCFLPNVSVKLMLYHLAISKTWSMLGHPHPVTRLGSTVSLLTPELQVMPDYPLKINPVDLTSRVPFPVWDYRSHNSPHYGCGLATQICNDVDAKGTELILRGMRGQYSTMLNYPRTNIYVHVYMYVWLYLLLILIFRHAVGWVDSGQWSMYVCSLPLPNPRLWSEPNFQGCFIFILTRFYIGFEIPESRI